MVSRVAVHDVQVDGPIAAPPHLIEVHELAGCEVTIGDIDMDNFKAKKVFMFAANFSKTYKYYN